MDMVINTFIFENNQITLSLFSSYPKQVWNYPKQDFFL